MTEPLKERCTGCSGAGIVPHTKRKMENGEPDPADFRVHEICERCNGEGRVLVNKAAILERPPGSIVDTFASWGADARSWWDECDPDILRLPAWLGGPGLTKPKGRD